MVQSDTNFQFEKHRMFDENLAWLLLVLHARRSTGNFGKTSFGFSVGFEWETAFIGDLKCLSLIFHTSDND